MTSDGAGISCGLLNLSPLRLVAGVGNPTVPVPGSERAACRFSVKVKRKGFFFSCQAPVNEGMKQALSAP